MFNSICIANNAIYNYIFVNTIMTFSNIKVNFKQLLKFSGIVSVFWWICFYLNQDPWFLQEQIKHLKSNQIW